MDKPHKVLLYEEMHPTGTNLLAECCRVEYARSFAEPDLAEQAKDADAIVLRAAGAVTKAVIDRAEKLKVIGRHGVGLDTIDVKYAKEKGIRVVYTPFANTESVAEHFVALALMLAKKVRTADIALRNAYWQARYEMIGNELRNKTLGVMGFGRIGRRTAAICRAGFNMQILYYDVVPFPETEFELEARRVSAERLFAESDFISINMPLIPATQGIVNRDLIFRMKPTAYLINMARGPLWNEADVTAALTENRIAGAGSDVFEVEPIKPDNPLLTLDNFVGTPHMSAHTDEALERMSLVAKDVIAVLEGREPECPVP